jgi:hypothetical protein
MPKSIYGNTHANANANGGSLNMKLIAEKITAINTRMANIMMQMTEEGANEKKGAIQERVDLLRNMVRNMK